MQSAKYCSDWLNLNIYIYYIYIYNIRKICIDLQHNGTQCREFPTQCFWDSDFWRKSWNITISNMLRLALDLLTRSKARLQTHNHNPTHRSKSSAHFCLPTYMRPKHITGNDVPKIVYDLTPGITTYCILQKNVLGFLLQRLREEWNRSKSNFSWNYISRSTSALDNHDNEHSKFQHIYIFIYIYMHISCCPMSQGNHPEMELPAPEKCAALTCRGAGWYPQAKPVPRISRISFEVLSNGKICQGDGIDSMAMSGTEKKKVPTIYKAYVREYPIDSHWLLVDCPYFINITIITMAILNMHSHWCHSPMLNIPLIPILIYINIPFCGAPFCSAQMWRSNPWTLGPSGPIGIHRDPYRPSSPTSAKLSGTVGSLRAS